MNFSQINDTLFVGTTPTSNDYGLLGSLGVRLVINMRVRPNYRHQEDRYAISYLWLPTFDNPILPIPMRKLIRGADAALAEIARGGKVYTYCARGRHRSIAMGAAILIAQGNSPESAIGLITERRPVADPNAFYIKRRIMMFAHQWPTSANVA